jgi:hypothetical protein
VGISGREKALFLPSTVNIEESHMKLKSQHPVLECVPAEYRSDTLQLCEPARYVTHQ